MADTAKEETKWGSRLAFMDPAELVAETKRHKRDLAFILNRRDEWLRLCPDSWVAVYEEKLVGFDTSHDCLVESMRVKFGPDFRLDSICYQFLPSRPSRTIASPTRKL
jgi:hypothetical protein